MTDKTASNLDNSFEKLEKSELKRIEISQLPKEIPDFKNSFDKKDSIIKNWLTNWITKGLAKGKLQENTLLPKKQDLAYYLGVSVGTVQNAIRCVEDSGLLESKQRIGTILRSSNSSNPIIRKASSKREKIIAQIKQYILQQNMKKGDTLPSVRALSNIFGNSTNTTRLALEFLASQGMLEQKIFRTNEANWTLSAVPVLNDEEKAFLSEDGISADTLVEKIEAELKNYIKENLKIGDKMPSHQELSDILKVSIKTIHDALQSLVTQGYLLTRRGRYGTTVIKIPGTELLQPVNETSIKAVPRESAIFASAQEAAFYSYQKIENNIKAYIRENFEIGDKIPAMDKLAKHFDVSSNTIRKALQNISKQGYVNFSRGRYGGTFVTDIPEDETQETFRWLAVSPSFHIVN